MSYDEEEEMRKNWPELRAKFAAGSFYHYREYVPRTTKLIDQETESLDDRLEEAREMRGQGPEVKGITISRRMEELQWFKWHFHRIAYRSVFISVYSQFETVMIEFCQDMQKARKFKVGVDDLGSSDVIGKCRTYLLKVADIPFPDDKGWSDIKLVQKVRNRIVHGGGEYQKAGGPDLPETGAVRKFVMDKGGETETFRTVNVTEQFLLYVVDLFSGFLVELAKVTPTD